MSALHRRLVLAIHIPSVMLLTLWATAAGAQWPAVPKQPITIKRQPRQPTPAPAPTVPAGPSPAPETAPVAPPETAPPAATPVEPPPPTASNAAEPPSTPPAEPSPAPSSGESIFGGRIFTYVRAPTDSTLDKPFQQVSASAWLEARPRFNEVSWARATVTADALAASIDGSTGVRANIREAYVAVAKSGWEARVGQQIIPWGNADGINPIDVLGARDYAFFSVDSEVRRVGAISVRGSWTPNGGNSPFSLTLITTPVFPSSKLLLPPGATPAGVVLNGVTRPVLKPENVEAALRAAFTGSGWDVALIGFRGFNHTPELELVSISPASTVIRQVHHRDIVGGIEASASPGKWIFRLEGAYVWSRDATDKDPTIHPSQTQGVFGIERPLGDRLRMQVQGVAKYALARPELTVPSDPDPLIAAAERPISQINAILLDYTEPLRVAGTARLAFTTESELFEAEIFAIMNAFGEDGVIRPLAALRPTDALRFSLGSEILFGPTRTPLGALRRYSGAFLEARYTF